MLYLAFNTQEQAEQAQHAFYLAIIGKSVNAEYNNSTDRWDVPRTTEDSKWVITHPQGVLSPSEIDAVLADFIEFEIINAEDL